MSEQKYKLIRVDERHHNGDSGLDLPTYRIMATRAIHLIDGRVVQLGDMGGFVDNADCLSHDGNCWIADNARTYGNTVVRNDALAKGDAVLGDSQSAKGATLSGKATVSDFATVAGSSVEDESRVSDHSQVRAGSLVSGRSSVYEFARMSASTASDNAVVRGMSTLLNSSVLGRAFVMGEADLDNCTVRDHARVGGFVRAKNVEVVGYSSLHEFASAIAHTGSSRRRSEQVVVKGKFSGTADALASKQHGAPRLQREGQTLFMEPDAFRGSVWAFLESDALIIDEAYIAERHSRIASDEQFDAQALGRDRESTTTTTRECGAPTPSGVPCGQMVSPDSQRCRAGHKAVGRIES